MHLIYLACFIFNFIPNNNWRREKVSETYFRTSGGKYDMKEDI
jgi:hypothetical protein